MKIRLLLINVGTPSDASVLAVVGYLSEFLADKRIVSLPSVIRYLLNYCLIIPLRARRSTHAYKAIWTPQGSPLLSYSQAMQRKLQNNLVARCKVELAIRYGNPSIETALLELTSCESITVIPRYSQYSSAGTGSALQKTLALLATSNNILERS